MPWPNWNMSCFGVIPKKKQPVYQDHLDCALESSWIGAPGGGGGGRGVTASLEYGQISNSPSQL